MTWTGSPESRADPNVPEISRFFGNVVAMFYHEHASPPFHARYRESEIRVTVRTGQIMTGRFPQRAQKLVLEWLELLRAELLENWDRARERKPLREIPPLG